MVGYYYIPHCDSEELWKTAQTPRVPFEMAAGTLEWQVPDEWYFCLSAGENESEFSEMFHWILTKQLTYQPVILDCLGFFIF